MMVDTPHTAPDPRGAQSALDTVTARWLLLIAGAVALGIFADRGQLAPRPLSLVPQLGGPWVALAFLWGAASSRKPLRGAFLGVAALLTGLASYVVFKAAFFGYYPVDGRIRYYGVYWLALATLVGTLFGAAGSRAESTDPRRARSGLTVLAGALVGEAAWVLYSWRDGGVWLLSAAEVLAAGLLLSRARTSGLAVAAVRSGCWAAVAFVTAYLLYRVL